MSGTATEPSLLQPISNLDKYVYLLCLYLHDTHFSFRLNSQMKRPLDRQPNEIVSGDS